VAATSPVHAILAAVSPAVDQRWPSQIVPYLIVMALATLVVVGIGIVRVRKWNPSRDVRPGQQEETGSHAAEDEGPGEVDLAARQRGHVDDRRRVVSTRSREVGGNPVYWRETRTWAYGKKIVFIRMAYWLMAALVAYGVYWTVRQGSSFSASSVGELSQTARLLSAFMLLSLVIVNALAVTSITSERDGKCLDLLMVTDLSPKEFLFGKLGGVLTISLDFILLPLAICGYLWWARVVSLENLVYLALGWLLLNLFSAMLGIHCGMMYWSSRRAIGTSLGTVFFLFLGVATTMVLLVSFTGNMEAQLPPFLAFIVGGGIGLYAAIGARNPSTAMALASGILPLTMFYAVTSLLLGRYLSVFLVLAVAYGFTTLAMMIPALGEYNIAMGRTKLTEDE
jgi:ABC-type transport system involved in multi-copper enzyme maturation permease subunit